MSRLVHYSGEPLESIRSIKQKPAPDMKPKGLWLSVEDGHGWRDWREAEDWGLRDGEIVTEITLNPDANGLWLKTSADILAFSERFVLAPDPVLGGTTFFVDWASVAAEFDGIIIAPYDWHLRLDDRVTWYYGWDCSSGCIWNKDAIASFKQLTTEEIDILRPVKETT